jgi:hypothetical protein
MKTRLIQVSIKQERELYDTLLSATMDHTEYDGCYVMQYTEHRGKDGQMIAEFMLRDASS